MALMDLFAEIACASQNLLVLAEEQAQVRQQPVARLVQPARRAAAVSQVQLRWGNDTGLGAGCDPRGS